jgi:hypothetical protein
VSFLYSSLNLFRRSLFIVRSPLPHLSPTATFDLPLDVVLDDFGYVKSVGHVDVFAVFFYPMPEYYLFLGQLVDSPGRKAKTIGKKFRVY